jgi:hypothetical protein
MLKGNIEGWIKRKKKARHEADKLKKKKNILTKNEEERGRGVCDDTLLVCVGGRPDEYELGQDMSRRPKHTHAQSSPRKVIRNYFKQIYGFVLSFKICL